MKELNILLISKTSKVSSICSIFYKASKKSNIK